MQWERKMQSSENGSRSACADKTSAKQTTQQYTPKQTMKVPGDDAIEAVDVSLLLVLNQFAV